jgi:hypothetical protein
MNNLSHVVDDGRYFTEQLGTDKGFIVTFSSVTPESAEDGDTSDHGFSDYDSCEPDKFDIAEGLSAVDKAIEYLTDKGASQASASFFHPGVWYSTEYQTEDYGTGEETEYGYHPKNFTEVEQEEIFKGMVGNVKRYL